MEAGISFRFLQHDRISDVRAWMENQFEFATGRRYVVTNLVDRAGNFKNKAGKIEILTIEQPARLLKSCEDSILSSKSEDAIAKLPQPESFLTYEQRTDTH